eukprot:GEMP01129687.1.p1 GENE.GEMP01129687.1~~GEMP01129687.1.p1  ORF type:complete len:147 (+),score=6.87 GEMP01129687.1:32-472(+)
MGDALWNWNDDWGVHEHGFYGNATQYYGVVYSNVEINMYDFVFKLDEDFDLVKVYKDIDVDEKSLVFWNLKEEDIVPRRIGRENLKIHPEPAPRKPAKVMKKTLTADSSGSQKKSEPDKTKSSRFIFCQCDIDIGLGPTINQRFLL